MQIKSLKLALWYCVPALWLNPVLAAVPAGQVAKLNSQTQAVKTLLSINKATAEQLVAIPGIGQKKAEAILAYIKEQGPIKNQQQLTEVKGIGAKLAEKIAAYVSF